jgi:hypothetical protein
VISQFLPLDGRLWHGNVSLIAKQPKQEKGQLPGARTGADWMVEAYI